VYCAKTLRKSTKLVIELCSNCQKDTEGETREIISSHLILRLILAGIVERRRLLRLAIERQLD